MATQCSSDCSDSIKQQPPATSQPEQYTDTPQPEYDFVDQPDQDYFCPVSLELLTEPHQTTCCGNHISQQAANRLIRDGKPCPLCKTDNFVTQQDLYFKRNGINKLKVCCPHKKSGCEWTGELGDLNQHTASCPKRPWKCPYCQFQSTHDIGTTDHAPQCDNQPVSCPNHCEVGAIPHCHAEKHLLTCPLQLVDCEFASAGCDVKVPRKDIASHMTESAQHHLMNATLLNLQLTKDLHQKMEEKDQQIVQLQIQLKKQSSELKQLDTKVVAEFQKVDTKLQQLDATVHTDFQKVNTKLYQLDTKVDNKFQKVDTKLQQLDAKVHTNFQKVDIKLEQLGAKVHANFQRVDTKLQQLDTRVHSNFLTVSTTLHHLDTKVDTKLHQLDTKVHTNFQKVDTKLHHLDTKVHTDFQKVDTKLHHLDTKVHTDFQKVDTKLHQLDTKVHPKFHKVETKHQKVDTRPKPAAKPRASGPHTDPRRGLSSEEPRRQGHKSKH